MHRYLAGLRKAQLSKNPYEGWVVVSSLQVWAFMDLQMVTFVL